MAGTFGPMSVQKKSPESSVDPITEPSLISKKAGKILDMLKIGGRREKKAGGSPVKMDRVRDVMRRGRDCLLEN